MFLKPSPTALRALNLLMILGLALSLTACGGSGGEDVGDQSADVERTVVFTNTLSDWGWLTFEGGDYFIEGKRSLTFTTGIGTKFVEFWVPDADAYYSGSITVSFASSVTRVSLP